jgi:hypothetical protein
MASDDPAMAHPPSSHAAARKRNLLSSSRSERTAYGPPCRARNPPIGSITPCVAVIAGLQAQYAVRFDSMIVIPAMTRIDRGKGENAKGGRFGPHNLHENRPGSFQSKEIVFAAYNNAGVRVFDISNAHEPKQVAFCIPPAPERMLTDRSGPERVTQSTDVFAAADGTLYVTDTNGGLSILA